jgi:hypothetical protein
MGTREETKTVKFCDICHSTTQNTGVLETCHVCGREFGWCCQTRLYNVYNMSICKDCFDGDTRARAIMDKYLEQWRATRTRIKTELQGIDRNEEGLDPDIVQ